jgi:hypothetical protein
VEANSIYNGNHAHIQRFKFIMISLDVTTVEHVMQDPIV